MARDKQGYNDRLDESMGMRRGKESSKMQSYKDRRDEYRGMKDKKMSKDYKEMPKNRDNKYGMDYSMKGVGNGVMGQATKTYSINALAAQKKDLNRLNVDPSNNRGYPKQAWEYGY